MSRAHGLFVTDLDETLLGPDRKVPTRNVEALREAAAAGVVIAIVTGRRVGKVREVFPMLDGVPFRLAASNGAVLMATGNATPSAVHSLDWELALEVAARHEIASWPALFITGPDHDGSDDGDTVYALAEESRAWHASPTPFRRETWVAAEAAAALARTLVHVAFLISERARAEALGAALRAELSARLSVHVVRNPVDASHALLELVPRGGKGIAVRALAAELGLAPERTAAIGDEANDADLLDAAGHRYAVGGSVLARRRADAHEVGGSASGAVADAIADFLARLTRA